MVGNSGLGDKLQNLDIKAKLFEQEIVGFWGGFFFFLVLFCFGFF